MQRQRGRRAERQGQDLNLRVPEGTVALEATAFPLCHPGSVLASDNIR